MKVVREYWVSNMLLIIKNAKEKGILFSNNHLHSMNFLIEILIRFLSYNLHLKNLILVLIRKFGLISLQLLDLGEINRQSIVNYK